MGDDIDRWTIDDIDRMVGSYQSSISPKSSKRAEKESHSTRVETSEGDIITRFAHIPTKVSVEKYSVCHVRVETEGGKLFTSFGSRRVFTLKTTPGDFFVKRTREDIKWLYDKLKEEYPNITVDSV